MATKSKESKGNSPKQNGAAKGASGANPMEKLIGDALGKDTDKKKKKNDEDTPVVESVKDLRQFLKEVSIEFQKISWPDRAQVIRETYSVIFLVAIITLMVLAFDWVLGNAVFGPLEHWARMFGGGVNRAQ